MEERVGDVLFVALAHVVDVEGNRVWDAMAIMAAMAIIAVLDKVQLFSL